MYALSHRHIKFTNFFSLIKTINYYRFLSLNTVVAYQRAKISGLNIVNVGDAASANAQVATISRTVAVDVAKSEVVTI